MSARITIGGVRSGEGKTTLSLGLMRALARSGRVTQGFKVGPDYLDTSYYRHATGRPGRNLDGWLQGEDGLRQSLARGLAGADIGIIEGVMGLYDGHRRGHWPSSTADVAKLTRTPVILVVNAAGCAASAAAVALGFRAFDPEVSLAGVVLNRWRTRRDATSVRAAFERVGIPVLGLLPPSDEVALPSRHLGLVVADEQSASLNGALNRMADLVERHVDLPALVALAESAGTCPVLLNGTSRCAPKVRIGVARDEAFCFYYPENLEILRELGADLVEFSPLRDGALPRELHGLYLGGGYPEIHARALAENASLRQEIAAQAAAGMPVYAECGGYLYLCQELTDQEGRTWPMAGVVPACAKMQNSLAHLGYEEGRTQRDSCLGPANLILRGHEFHYAEVGSEQGSPCALRYEGRLDGFCSAGVFASFLHVSFLSCRGVVAHWLERAADFRETSRRGENP